MAKSKEKLPSSLGPVPGLDFGNMHADDMLFALHGTA